MTLAHLVLDWYLHPSVTSSSQTDILNKKIRNEVEEREEDEWRMDESALHLLPGWLAAKAPANLEGSSVEKAVRERAKFQMFLVQ